MSAKNLNTNSKDVVVLPESSPKKKNNTNAKKNLNTNAKDVVVLLESSPRCIIGAAELCIEAEITDGAVYNNRVFSTEWVRYHDDEHSDDRNIGKVINGLANMVTPPACLLVSFPFVHKNQEAGIVADLKTLAGKGCTIFWRGAKPGMGTAAPPEDICKKVGGTFSELKGYAEKDVTGVTGYEDVEQKRHAWLEYCIRLLYMGAFEPARILRIAITELLNYGDDVDRYRLPDFAREGGQEDIPLLSGSASKKLVERYVEKGCPAIAGRTKVIEDLKREIAMLALATDLNVLVVGETGTGKENAAYFLHELGPSRSKPYLELNCAGIDDNTAESMLFGHKKGSFTDAVSDRKGIVERANGGTIFLDELPDLSPRIQAKLLRFVQFGEYYIMGDGDKKQASCRIIAGGQPDRIRKNVREDLIYRLAEGVVRMPSLKDLPEDDLVIIARNRADGLQGRKMICTVKGLSGQRSINQGDIDSFWQQIESCKQLMRKYDWPGNVRELYAMVKRSLMIGKPFEDLINEAINSPVFGRVEERQVARPTAQAVNTAAIDIISPRSVEEVLPLREAMTRYVRAAAEIITDQKQLPLKLEIAVNTLKNYLRPKAVKAKAVKGAAEVGK